MNILTQRPPDSVCVCGKEYKIRTDFRVGIKAEEMLLDGELEQPEGILRLLQLYYPVIPPHPIEAAEAILQFYSAQSDGKDKKAQEPAKPVRAYDYDVDAAYIYAAFLADYGIDLDTTDHLHWWKFRAMFAALSPNNTICKIMEYRCADISKFKGAERTFYQKMKKQYALPLRAAKQESLDAAAEYLMTQK